jgi:hypothetical protein
MARKCAGLVGRRGEQIEKFLSAIDDFKQKEL